MYTNQAPLAKTASALKNNQLDIHQYINEMCDRIDRIDPHVKSLLPEPGRRERLLLEAEALIKKYPDPDSRPPLFGILLGVKDIFHTDGFPTRAGSKLPAEVLTGKEAHVVSQLKNTGALVVGKTVTTEFAYFQPGPTRNPVSIDHTPGGSSSGSAAAVSGGLCQLSMGTQTIGSITRPASFCGIIGFKPSYGRISVDGVIPFSASADHVGIFTQDLEGVALTAPIICKDWKSLKTAESIRPRLGIPEGKYLQQAERKVLEFFESEVQRLVENGFTVKKIPLFEHIEEINQAHRLMIAGEMAASHQQWFNRYAHLYSDQTHNLILNGQKTSHEEIKKSQAGQIIERDKLEIISQNNDIDLWLSPSTTSPALKGLETTGDPVMNLPWTYMGLPTISLPRGKTPEGLPLGLQFCASFYKDEELLDWMLHI